MEKVMNGKEVAKEISYAINRGDREFINELMEELINDHRTLQQRFCGRFVMNYIRNMHNRYKDGWYDDRNEQSCKSCHQMWEAFKKENPFYDDERDVEFSFI